MNYYNRTVSVIWIILSVLLSVTVFADNGYTVTFSNNNRQVNVAVSNGAGDSVDILTDETLAVKAYAQFPATTSTGL